HASLHGKLLQTPGPETSSRGSAPPREARNDGAVRFRSAAPDVGRIHSYGTERTDFPMTTRAFNQEVREEVFAKVVETVAEKLYDPALNGVDWNRIANERRNAIITS